ASVPARAIGQIQEAVAVGVSARDARDRKRQVVRTRIEVAAGITIEVQCGGDTRIKLAERTESGSLISVTSGIGAAVESEEEAGIISRVGCHDSRERLRERKRRARDASRRTYARDAGDSNVVGRTVEFISIRYRRPEGLLHADLAGHSRTVVCRR